jgi:Ca2+-binding RTX toxin-like protein
MPSVTSNGTNSKSIALNFDSSSNYALAAQIAAQINAGVKAGTVVTSSDVDGLPPTVPAGKIGAYYQTQTDEGQIPSDHAIDLVTTRNAVVLGGANDIGYQEILSDSGTNLTFVAPDGNGTVVAGGGASLLEVFGGNWSLNTGNGDDVIVAWHGVDTISAGAGKNFIQLSDVIASVKSAGDDNIEIDSGAVTVNATRASSDYVDAGSSNLYFLGGTGSVTIFGGTGSDTYLGSALSTGSQRIDGGTAGNNYLRAGNGAATLTGGGNNDTLVASGGTAQLLIAGSGNETLSAVGSWANDTLIARSGNDIIKGGRGNDTFVGSSGNATITAGAGQDVFEFIKGEAGGHETVIGYDNANVSSIRIHLEGYTPGQAAHAINHQTVSSNGVTVSLSDGTTITFQHVTGLMTGSNFV